MLTGVFHLHEQQVRHVMTPGPAIVTVDVSDSVHSAADLCARSGHTRLVVIEHGNRDHIRGTLHASDVIRGLRDPSGRTRLESLVREALVVPETMALDIVLATLRARRSSMAVVVDEYGTAGIVTVEDLLEEIAGEIADETDSSADGIRRTSDDAWQIDGHVPINDLADHGVQLPVDSETVNSVGGVVLAQIGRLARPGD
jgi:CBS domain containing-hemolysin-like protein